MKLLAVHDINVVLDVGANTGQFARNLRDAGFKGRIVSFEPSELAHSKLLKAAKMDPQWTVAPRGAIGDHDGKVTINISRNSVSSSLLPMLATHLAAEPESCYVGTEEVELHRLDTIAADFASDHDHTFLKLDVQGFEYEVLQGAPCLLKRICGIQLELSLVPLYQGQQLFDPMLHWLQELGFELWSLVPSFVDWNTGRLLQADGIFFRIDRRDYHQAE
jgi:FkbM family methyltransferase